MKQLATVNASGTYNRSGDVSHGRVASRLPMFSLFFGGNRRSAPIGATLMITAIALIDWMVVGEIPFGFLYLAPMLVVGAVLEPWQIGAIAVVCTFPAEVFDDLPWTLRTGVSREVLYFAALLGTGLFVREVSHNRRIVLDNRVKSRVRETLAVKQKSSCEA